MRVPRPTSARRLPAFGDNQKAIFHFSRALQLDPGNILAREKS